MAACYSLLQGGRCLVSILTGGGVLINRPMAWAIFSCDQASISIIIIIVAVSLYAFSWSLSLCSCMHVCLFVTVEWLVNCSAIASSNKFRGRGSTQPDAKKYLRSKQTVLDSSDVQTVMFNAYYCHSRMETGDMRDFSLGVGTWTCQLSIYRNTTLLALLCAYRQH